MSLELRHEIRLAEQHAKEHSEKRLCESVEVIRDTMQAMSDTIRSQAETISFMQTRIDNLENDVRWMTDDWNEYRRAVVNGACV